HLSLARPTLLLFCIPTATPQTHTLSLHDALPILATLKDLPAKRETTAHVRAAMALIEAGATSAGSRKAKPPPELPDDLAAAMRRSEEHTSELQSRENLVCRLLLEKKKEAELRPTD